MNKTLIIGDLHIKDFLGYADYIEDKREPERQQILYFILEKSKDCDKVVFMGDIFNYKNNTSASVKMLVNFLERFKDKKLYLIAGNHESHADGRTALDFLNELSNKNWKVIAKDIYEEDELVFCPYFYNTELGVEDNDAGTKAVMDKLNNTKGRFLFAHHALSDSKIGDIDTQFFNEILLPKKEIETKFTKTFLGHIHSSKVDDNVIYTGSVFNNELGETQKYIYTFDGESVEQIQLPGRGIYKLTNPTQKQIDAVDANNIVKVFINKRGLYDNKLEESLKKFDAFIIVENYSKEREDKKVIEDGEVITDVPLSRLLELYAKDKQVPEDKLKRGFELINV